MCRGDHRARLRVEIRAAWTTTCVQKRGDSPFLWKGFLSSGNGPLLPVPGTRPPQASPCLPSGPTLPVPSQATRKPQPLSLPLYPTAHPLQPPSGPSGPLFRPQGLCTGPPHPVTVFSQLVLGTCTPHAHRAQVALAVGLGRGLPHMASLRQ